MANTRKVIYKACDACRRRKTKCSGQQPCLGCMSADLTCTYISHRRQGGNSGARATVLNELRSNEARHAAATSASVSSESNRSPLINIQCPEASFTNECINAYLRCIWPVVPVLTQHALETEAQLARTSLGSRQFILAFCAYVANFGNVLQESQIDRQTCSPLILGQQCLNDALQLQRSMQPMNPTPRSMFVSFFLYGAHAGLGDYQRGWFYLREATTLYTMLRRDAVSWYDQQIESCIFWILLISER